MASGGGRGRVARRPGAERTMVQVTGGLRMKRVTMSVVDSEVVESRPAQTKNGQGDKASNEARQINIQANARFLAGLS